MNAARLKALIEDLLAAEDQAKTQDQLSALASALQNYAGQQVGTIVVGGQHR